MTIRYRTAGLTTDLPATANGKMSYECGTKNALWKTRIDYATKQPKNEHDLHNIIKHPTRSAHSI